MSSPFPEFFALFGIAPRFAIDSQDLSRAYREVLAQVHPDRHAAAGAAERRAAMQLASHANEAYEVLRSDSARAAYLCRQQGVAVDGAGAPPIPPAFLQRQMDWRERLEQARDGATLAALATEVERQRAQLRALLAQQIDELRDFPAAAASVRALLFIEKMDAEIARVTAEREDAARPPGT